jgi:glycine cleavage system H lipoate-binding protein
LIGEREVLYSEEHLWIRPISKSIVEIGINDAYVSKHGGVTFMEMSSGKYFKGKSCGIAVFQIPFDSGDDEERLICPLDGDLLEVSLPFRRSLVQWEDEIGIWLATTS